MKYYNVTENPDRLDRQMCIRISKPILDKVKKLADENERSISKQIVFMIREQLMNAEVIKNV